MHLRKKETAPIDSVRRFLVEKMEPVQTVDFK